MSAEIVNNVHIAAAGYGTRMQEHMATMDLPDLPKHLLRTGNPEGETLLGRVIQQALGASTVDLPVVYANPENAGMFAKHPHVRPFAEVRVKDFGETFKNNSFSAYIDNLLLTGRRTLGCAGDYYTETTWTDFVAAHDESPYPVTFLVAEALTDEGGAVFDLAEDGKIERFIRKEVVSKGELINIGMYVFDPHELVLRSIEGLVQEYRQNKANLREDIVAYNLISASLVGAVVVSDSFNINTLNTYEALLEHTDRLKTGN